MKKFVVGITGASGIIIGIRLVEILAKKNKVYTILSKAARLTAKYEIGKKFELPKSKNIVVYNEDEIDKNIASGSFKIDGMVIAPCSMKTLAAISNGFSNNLITRVADVCIKEKRKLILVPRETPLSQIHLENMLKLAKCGVYILPPVVQFYSVKTLEQLVDFICGKILDYLGVKHKLYKEWNPE